VPALTISGPLGSLLALAREPSVAKAIVADPGRATSSAGYPPGTFVPYPVPPSSSMTTQSYRYHNADGRFGAGVTVGIVEATGGNRTYEDEQGQPVPYGGAGCRLFETHDAFAEAPPVEYMHTSSVACSADAECVAPCAGSNGEAPRCVRGACVSDHLTATASRIASSVRDGSGATVPFHAARARLRVANNFQGRGQGNQRSLEISAENLAEAYHWLHSGPHPVRIINESYQPSFTAENYRSWLSDWYARTAGTLFVQAVGNQNPPTEEEQSFPRVACRGFNSLCVGSARTTGLYPDAVVSFRLSSGSRWKNELPEQEKPDLVAEGENAHYATMQPNLSSPGFSNSHWTRGTGTSLAAPAVAGLAALVAETCSASTQYDALALRAMLRTRGTSSPHVMESVLPPNTPATCLPHGPLSYPTPHFGEYMADCDYKSGTGLATARLLPGGYLDCSGQPSDPYAPSPPHDSSPSGQDSPQPQTSGTGRFDVDDLPWEPLDRAVDGPTPEIQSSRGTKTTSPELRANRQAAQWRWAPIYDYQNWSFPAGTRFRATLTYFSCPMPALSSLVSFDANGAATVDEGAMAIAAMNLAPARNLDLVLLGWVNGQREVIAVAESLVETNEGFDTTFEKDYDRIELRVVDWQDGNCAQPAWDGFGEPFEIDDLIELPGTAP
jgi:hypothetical protein